MESAQGMWVCMALESQPGDCLSGGERAEGGTGLGFLGRGFGIWRGRAVEEQDATSEVHGLICDVRCAVCDVRSAICNWCFRGGNHAPAIQ
jgi:hypothetical protein